MSMKKIVFTNILVLGIGSISVAQASDLYITNCTKSPSTSVINTGLCSTIIGPEGTTPPDCQQHTVSESNVNKACFANKTNCKADVYMTNNCSGPVVATVYFDTKTGIKSDKTVIYDASYKITGAGFSIGMSGGPAAKKSA